MNHFRIAMLAGFLATAGMFGGALFFQYYLELEPCPLCILQRIAVLALGLVFLAGLVHGPKGRGRRIYAVLATVVSLAGVGVAGRHVWLQHQPPSLMAECGAGLDYWLETLPPWKVLQKMFHGTGDCGEVVFRFLGLSIPEWTLIAFAVLVLYSLSLLWNRKTRGDAGGQHSVSG